MATARLRGRDAVRACGPGTQETPWSLDRRPTAVQCSVPREIGGQWQTCILRQGRVYGPSGRITARCLNGRDAHESAFVKFRSRPTVAVGPIRMSQNAFFNNKCLAVKL